MKAVTGLSVLPNQQQSECGIYQQIKGEEEKIARREKNGERVAGREKGLKLSMRT